MANTQETIADIIAEMRALSNPISDGIIAINGRIIADRLDAAHRREVATTKESLAVGNSGDCAKLREALSAALDMIFDLQVCNRSPIANSVYAVRRKIKAALAAPARNCDKYATIEEAKKAFEVAHKDKVGFINFYKDTFTWLYAPATEQEGGNDGNE